MRHKYLTLARLRDIGITVAMLSDALALELILDVSGSLDDLTAQFFQPELEVHPASGDKCSLVHRRDLVPMLEVTNIEIDYEKCRTGYSGMGRLFDWKVPPSFNVDISRWEISPATEFRTIDVMSGEFPEGTGNVLLTGAFGWLENRKVFETTLANPISSADTTITLTDVLNTTGWIEKDDFVVVEIQAASKTQPALLYVDIVQDIAGNILTVDEVQGQPGLPIPAGAKVRSFGRFPSALREVMEKLAKNAYDVIYGGSSTIDPNRVISEKVDNYSYQLESMGKSASYSGYGYITGDTRLDKVLQSFQQPRYVGFA